MKNLKKIIFALLIVLIAGVALNVNAAYAYRWTVNGKTIGRGESTENASWTTSDDYTGGILTLENYNGGQLKIECVGTGMADQVFAIKLVGDNKITVDKGVGIVADADIVFIGDGKLTIKAAVPIGSFSIVNSDDTLTDIAKAKYSGNTTAVIKPSTTVKEVVKEATKEETTTEETTKEEATYGSTTDTTWEPTWPATCESQLKTCEKKAAITVITILAIAGGLLLINFIVIIILAVKLAKKKKEN